MFVALSLPEEAVDALIRFLPSPSEHVRPTRREHVHLTLHFLGERDLGGVIACLDELELPSFELALVGVGCFPSAGGDVTLWAGAAESPELRRLHEEVAVALRPIGFVPEARPYRPHVSLARCRPGVAAEVVQDFEEKGRELHVSCRAREVGLYSSRFANGEPVYRSEATFGLR